jgi:energy-coupling factor transporter ATP-binding protein EcfA2
MSLHDRVRAAAHSARPRSTGPLQDGSSQRFKFNITASVSGAGAMRVARTIEGTAQEVASQLARPIAAADKNSVPLFSVGVLRADLVRGDSVSTKEALAAVQAVVLDFDHVTQAQVEHAQAALRSRGFVFVMYPTHSWSAEAPRWRIVVFLSRQVSVERYAALWAGLARIAGTQGDEAAKKPAQRYFLHSCPPGQEAERPAAIVAGSVLVDPDELAALAPDMALLPPAPPHQDSPATSINMDVLGAELQDNRTRDAGLIAKQCPMVGAFAAGEPVDEPVWRAMAGVLKFCRDGERLWHEWSSKDDRYEAGEAQRKWDLYQAGPTRCGAAPQCATCKHHAVLGSPVQLGDVPADAPVKPAQDSVQGLQGAVESGGLRPILDTAGRLNFVTVAEIDGRMVRTVMPADSEAASDAIVALASASGKIPSDKAVENFKAQLRHGARRRGEAVAVALRVAEHDSEVFVDLGPGRIARIAGSGVRLVDDVADGVPLFRRGMGAGQLPDPELFTDARAALRFASGVFVGRFALAPEQAIAAIAAILEWHRTGTPHPILEAVGPAGCGKSTFADFVLGLIDPPGGGRVTVGTAAPDIAAAAQQRFVLPLDNAGKLDKATSDMLCIVSTGGTLLVRLLYTNGETANLMLHRPLMVTAVSPVCTAPDLQSRVVRVELHARRDGYAAESELRAGWDLLRPKMLGAIYTLLSGALRELPAVRARTGWGHRLVDFDQMGEAMMAAGAAKPGTFIAAIGKLRESMARRTASGDLFLVALLEVLRKLAPRPTHAVQPSLSAVLQMNPSLAVVKNENGQVEITSRPGALHRLLPPPAPAGYVRDRGIPATERGLVDALRRVQPLLSGLGVDVSELASGTRTLLRFAFDPGSLVDA